MIHLIYMMSMILKENKIKEIKIILRIKVQTWFLAQKLGDKAWFIQSEKNYYQHHQTYYNNIRALGLEYLELDYSKAFSFLLMLSNSLR
jgi:hypothetical protein